MWFWFSLIALICWSGSDLFSKIGCQDADDKYSHLKMVMAVGLVMGLHAAYEIFINGTEINGSIILTYLPVSLLYISSMTIGYIGLRYIELSISSPICNSSGALVAVLALATGGLGELVPAQLAATALVCVGVIGLGIVEAHHKAHGHDHLEMAVLIVRVLTADLAEQVRAAPADQSDEGKPKPHNILLLSLHKIIFGRMLRVADAVEKGG